ncbi:hypothetical protein GCM10009122_28210 [Fulvivirga kasyanovii]|uniref:Lipocalin-like domain-containing protein n=1 Tax=Fulvivirga kasyanovii TaxID=396812 RepID=A0ABW9RQ44_9BACT|nr:hypothetical protein [Fulvivirga kasyanovii]MTI26279.1 hypothetical protein [Fulvivirga kasyanovii]
MKSHFLICLVALSVFAFSCSDDDESVSVSPAPATLTAAIIEGTWHITQLVKSGNDISSHFDGYNLTFHDNGNLQASNGTKSQMGSWTAEDDNGVTELVILYTSKDDFDELLSEDWAVVEIADAKVTLEHDGTNGVKDYLTIEKN